MEFEMNKGILDNMRVCLQGMARMKNIKLEHPIEEYDMPTMLKMFKEMEDMPVRYSFNDRLARFWSNVVYHLASGVLWFIRGLVFIVEKVSGTPECKVAAEKFRADHDKSRKE